MKVSIEIRGLAEVSKMLAAAPSQARYATALAINATLADARKDVQGEMLKVFDRPTPWVINSLREKRATKQNPIGELAFKDRNSAESSRTMVLPHVEGGQRVFKAMEVRLHAIGLLPSGWMVVPGQAAKLDSFGNMTRGQVSQLLNVLGAYTEAGYNKANSKTREKLARGGKRAQYGQYGFEWVVARVGDRRWGALQPGVYQRVKTGFGSSLKPVLIFVRTVNYRPRLDFFGIVRRTVDNRLPHHMRAAIAKALSTARYSHQVGLF